MSFKKMIHTVCRGEFYPFSEVKRLQFPDNLVPWTVKFDDYNPQEYNSKVLINKPWADPPIDDGNFHPKWNDLDGKINRKSHTGLYKIVEGRPLNPVGRTGLKGRGVLGKWGPNHAADPIVTRWKISESDGSIIKNPVTNLPILLFCAIQRHDNNSWAIPGGMVDPGEHITETLQREFMEEALNSLQNCHKETEDLIKNFFKSGTEVYTGYVDDPRNTDNAWMETVAFNFHDNDGSVVGKINFQAGDDAKNVKWIEIDSKLHLYANHINFIEAVAKLRNAHW